MLSNSNPFFKQPGRNKEPKLKPRESVGRDTGTGNVHVKCPGSGIHNTCGEPFEWGNNGCSILVLLLLSFKCLWQERASLYSPSE